MLTFILRRTAAGLVAAAALSLPARATWSILVVDTQTGEVCCAAATCLENFNLVKDLPVIRVKAGGGVSQGQIDLGAIHRGIMWDGLIAGDKPKEILDAIFVQGSFKARQYGVVAFEGNPETYSGPLLGLDYYGISGKSGSLKFAIQGNVITGPAVVEAARAALLATDGDLTQRVMAAMEAARAMGGDGRCSCLTGLPYECGSPPPEFTKSAHCAYIVASRQGDTDGTCIHATGCATGDYYLKLNLTGDWDDPDPVLELQAEYDAWRAGMAGHPDHLQSTAVADSALLMADGATSTDVLLRLVDLEGVDVPVGGATITVEPEDGAAPLATATEVVDHGDGSYTVRMTAGADPGTQGFLIRVDDGFEVATLWPPLELEVAPYADMWVGVPAISASAGGEVPLVANLGAASAAHPYLVLASGSGSVPGVDLGGVVLPLNPDGVLTATLAAAGSPLLPGSIGVLDDGGRGEAALVAPAGLLGPLVGLELTWAAVDYAWPYAATSAATLDIEP